MNRIKNLRTFGLLTLVIMSTVGCVTYLGLQLAPIAREMVGRDIKIINEEVGNATLAAVASATRAESPIIAPIVISTPMTETATETVSVQEGVTEVKTLPTAIAVTSLDEETEDISIDSNAELDAQERASSSRQAVVDAPLVNVRSAPTIAGEILAQLQQNEEVEILETTKDGAWHRICCPLGTVAPRVTWVSAGLLRLIPTSTDESTLTVQPSASLAAAAANSTDMGSVTGIVNATLVNVRGGPGTQYPVVGQVSEAMPPQYCWANRKR